MNGIWTSLKHNFVTFTTIIVGFVAFGLNEYGNLEERDFLKVILALIILLTTAELVDKSGKLKRLQDDVNSGFQNTVIEIKRNAASTMNAKFLETKAQIVDENRRLMEEGFTTELKTVLYSGANSPDEIADDAARVIKERLDAGIQVTFTAVIVIDFKNPPDGFLDRIEAKRQIYEDQGVWERIDLRLLDQKPTIGTDVVVLDDRHVFLLVADPLLSADIYRAVLIENRQDVAKTFSTWIDREVLPKSKLFTEAEKEIKRQRQSSASKKRRR